MTNRRKAALALLLGTIFLPLTMNRYQPGCGTALERYGDDAPAIRAVATAFAAGEQWAIDAVETWEAAGRPGEIPTQP